MIQFYVMMIKTKKVTLDAVPALWRDKVAAALKEAC